MRVCVCASGMLTPVGFNSRSSCAAIRAGVSAVKSANLWDKEAGAYISAARVPLPQWWEGATKLPSLIAPAILECLNAASPVLASAIPLLVGVASEDRPQYPASVVETLIEEVESLLDCRFHPSSRLLARGQVSAAIALQEAAELMEAYRVPYCIVAGVESLLQQRIVEYYMDHRRVMTPNNSNGFFPGEAGAAVLVRPSSGSKELEILGIGFGRERATIESDLPFRADGMTEAVANALLLADSTIDEISYRITDLNGEHYKFKEAAFISSRFHHGPRENFFDLWHPIEFIGEIGAGIGPCALALALDAGARGWAPGSTVLLHFGNDNGERAAIVARMSGEAA